MQVAIVVYPGMTALDALGPYEVLRGLPGVEMRLVGKEVGPVVTDGRVLVVGASHSYDETPSPDVVMVPGSATDTATTMTDATLLAWLRAVHPRTRFTTSVCSGSLILAAAGLLEGLPATSHWAALPFLPRFGAEPRPDARVVRAGKIWTSAGVSAGIDLALSLAAELVDEDAARVAQLILEYDPQPPFDAGHMSKASPEIRDRARREMARMALSPREVLAMPRALVTRWMRVLTASRRSATRTA